MLTQHADLCSVNVSAWMPQKGFYSRYQLATLERNACDFQRARHCFRSSSAFDALSFSDQRVSFALFALLLVATGKGSQAIRIFFRRGHFVVYAYRGIKCGDGLL